MKHEIIEKNLGLMGLFIIFIISLAGLAEIVPLFFQIETQKPMDGLKPLTSLQLEGRDIYIREGCHVCHTQMVRSLYVDTKRYGRYSDSTEHVYEHPFLWGSKRTGPDLARIGGRYSDDWHRIHLRNPRLVVPGSKMPNYSHLSQKILDGKYTARKMISLQKLGVPYTVSDISNFDVFIKGKTEEDALVAYLQQLGTVLNVSRN